MQGAEPARAAARARSSPGPPCPCRVDCRHHRVKCVWLGLLARNYVWTGLLDGSWAESVDLAPQRCQLNTSRAKHHKAETDIQHLQHMADDTHWLAGRVLWRGTNQSEQQHVRRTIDRRQPPSL